MPSRRASRGSLLACGAGKLFLRLTGWRVTGQLPDSPKLVVIAAPHTSNWDFVYLLAAAWSLRLRINWLGKSSLFSPPFGAVMRMLGGIPVDRSRASNLVDQLAQRFDKASSLAVVIPPSGTRGQTPYWKSGFYWTAYKARATVICGYLDYATRTAGLGHVFIPSGSVSDDMPAVRASYAGVQARCPERAGPIRLKEEDA